MRSAFSVFQSSEQAKNAKLKFDGTPFSYAIEAAQNKDRDAIFYLILESLGPIASAFIKYYIRKREFEKGEISEKSHDYFNNFIHFLYKLTAEQKGPFYSFKKEVFVTNQDDSFILNKFRYYMYGYARKIANKMFEKETEAEKNELLQSEYDYTKKDSSDEGAFEQFSNDKRMIPVSTKKGYPKGKNGKGKNSKKYEILAVRGFIDDNPHFVEFLKQKKPKMYKQLMLVGEGKTQKQVSEIMGWNLSRNFSAFWMSWVAMGKLYKDFQIKYKQEIE